LDDISDDDDQDPEFIVPLLTESDSGSENVMEDDSQEKATPIITINKSNRKGNKSDRMLWTRVSEDCTIQ